MCTAVRTLQCELGASVAMGAGDAALAGRMADALLERGIYVIPFSYPVVPKGKARIRVQVSAVHTSEDLERAMQAFSEVKQW